MIFRIAYASAALLAASALAATASAQDARRGKVLYQASCASCHDDSTSAIGPTLVGVVGRKAAMVAGYRYSNPLRRSEITWTPDRLESFIKDPQGVVRGNRMPFDSSLKEKDAADIVAYLGARR